MSRQDIKFNAQIATIQCEFPRTEPTIAARFKALFPSNENYHVTFDTGSATLAANGKVKVKYSARHHSPLTERHFARHIEGRYPLVLSPATEDGRSSYLSVDCDDFEIDLANLASKIEKLKLPALLCRSKSGGAHLFQFFDHPVLIADAEALARSLARQLGLPDNELFPRVQNPGTHPFCINIPYLGSVPLLAKAYCIKRLGSEMTAGEFARAAERARMNAEQRIQQLAFQPPVLPLRGKPRQAPMQFSSEDQPLIELMIEDKGKGVSPVEYTPDADPVLKMDCALNSLPADMPYSSERDRPSWWKMTCTLADNMEYEDGFVILHAWCCRSPQVRHHDQEANRAAWDRAFYRKRKVRFSPGTIYHFADKADPDKKWLSEYYDILSAAAAQ